MNNNLKSFISKLDEINISDIDYAFFLSETCLSNIDQPGINKKTISSNREYLIQYSKTDISFELACLYTSILENIMPEEDDDISFMIKDVKLRQKDYIKQLDINEYSSDFYYQNIIKLLDEKNQYKEKHYGDIYFGFNSFSPYNIFGEDEITLKDFKEVTPLAYFDKTFYYPYVADKNTVWMSIIPHETNTMKSQLEMAKGKVLIYGLGLGYFPIMCAIKDNVKEITVIEFDQNVIDIFNDIILPCFKDSNLKEIKIIKDDAVNYAKNISKDQYDYVFADIWHDEKDGLDFYLKFISLEKEGITYTYWIEQAILVYLKRILVNILAISENEETFKKNLNLMEKKDKLLIQQFKPLLDKENLSTEEDIKKLLSLDGLKEFLHKNF